MRPLTSQHCQWIVTIAVLIVTLCDQAAAAAAPEFRLATFSADVTIPIGHPIIAGARMPAKTIVEPLSARGFVLLGGDKPLVVVAVEWCEIRNDAYDRWREVLATAAGTDMQHVLVTATHVHDAPVVDLTAQKLLEQANAEGQVVDLDFHEQAVQRTVAALRGGLKRPLRITHFGVGQAKVVEVACNRRYEAANGEILFNRSSMKSDQRAKEAPEGTIDPWLKTLSFWNGEKPILALHCYAVHPMSYYGSGGVSADFVGLARRRRQSDDHDVFQIYTTGCSGDITTGKYNDGTPEVRAVLADRVYDGMVSAWKNTQRATLDQAALRCIPLKLNVRNDTGFSTDELQLAIETGDGVLTKHGKPLAQSLAALALSWRLRVEAGRPIDLPVIDFGSAKLILLPAEAYVEYQSFAQRQCPQAFVMVMGYGECGPGFIPTDQAANEHDSNLGLWRWVEPPCENTMHEAIVAALLSGARQHTGSK
ncbi:MAG: hypothetical protein WD468_10275 [Pirellulales bacterium]